MRIFYDGRSNMPCLDFKSREQKKLRGISEDREHVNSFSLLINDSRNAYILPTSYPR